MVLLHLGTLFLLASVHCQPHKRQADGEIPGEPENECCDQKMVGDDRYFNIGYDHMGMTYDLNCLSPCIFEKEDQPGSKYCFAAGDMKVECEDDMDFTPTGGPRPTEGPDGNGATDDNGEGPDGGVTGDGGSSCRCGLEGERRIVGGQDSTGGKYPWTVTLNAGPKFGFEYHAHFCGATLIASNWVVTAAHCITEGPGFTSKDDLNVVVGAFDLSDLNGRDGDPNSKSVALEIDPIVHEDWNPETSSNDIALLKLSESVDLDVYTPACLADLGSDYTGQNGRVYGWGSLAACPPSSPDILQEIEITIISDEECDAQSSDSVTAADPDTGECSTEASSYEGRITEEMLCAGAPGKDSCQGDSGGPFTVKNGETNQHELVGVVSWGAGCAADGMYGVYAEVAKLRTWIDSKIEENGGATFCN